MFLYAKLVSRNLYDQLTREQLLEEIEEPRFPDGLEQAYVLDHFLDYIIFHVAISNFCSYKNPHAIWIPFVLE